MGMLYYECKNCGGCVAIMAQFIGNVRCVKCNILLEGKTKGVPRFETHTHECKKCNFIISFEGVSNKYVSCVKDNLQMTKLVEQRTKKGKRS